MRRTLVGTAIDGSAAEELPVQRVDLAPVGEHVCRGLATPDREPEPVEHRVAPDVVLGGHGDEPAHAESPLGTR